MVLATRRLTLEQRIDHKVGQGFDSVFDFFFADISAFVLAHVFGFVFAIFSLISAWFCPPTLRRPRTPVCTQGARHLESYRVERNPRAMPFHHSTSARRTQYPLRD